MTAGRDHAGLVVLGPNTCDELLDETTIGRIAFVHDGGVDVFPVNYRWHRSSVVFRTAEGAKLDAATLRPAVAFEIDGWDSDKKTGWSVVVHGTAEEVEDDEERAELEGLDLRPWAGPKGRDRWVRVRPTSITGRKIV